MVADAPHAHVPRRRHALGAAALAGTLALAPATARAQLPPLDDGIEVGEWTFEPSLELRIRSEYRRDPADVGGDIYAKTAVHADGFNSATPAVTGRAPRVRDQWIIAERARIGLGVRYDVIAAKVVLQDARALGVTPGVGAVLADGSLGVMEPHEAYMQLVSDREDPVVRFRIGRQRVAWGDGRLVGDNEWAPRGGSIDAARLSVHVGPVDLEALGALLSAPGSLPPAYVGAGDTPPALGTGSQLYGLSASWHVVDLFHAHATVLARVAREPLDAALTPGDVYVFDARLSGDHRGVSYAVEGAYETGRVASFGDNRSLSAFAAAGRASLRTALPWSFDFGVLGSFASGDDGSGGTVTRFDPILPEARAASVTQRGTEPAGHGGVMGLYGWSNSFDAGARVTAEPFDDFSALVAGRFVGLHEAGDRWSTAELVPVAAAPDNTSVVLGEQIDAAVAYQPWPYLTFTAGYGLFVSGEAADAILRSAGREAPGALHYGFLQAELKAPK